MKDINNSNKEIGYKERCKRWVVIPFLTFFVLTMMLGVVYFLPMYEESCSSENVLQQKDLSSDDLRDLKAFEYYLINSLQNPTKCFTPMDLYGIFGSLTITSIHSTNRILSFSTTANVSYDSGSLFVEGYGPIEGDEHMFALNDNKYKIALYDLKDPKMFWENRQGKFIFRTCNGYDLELNQKFFVRTPLF